MGGTGRVGGGQMGGKSKRVGEVRDRAQAVESKGTRVGEGVLRAHLLRAPACLLYKFIIFWQSAHLLFHSFQVHDLRLKTCSRKQVPVNSEVWFSPFWTQQRRGEGKAKAQRGQTAYWILDTLQNTLPPHLRPETRGSAAAGSK